MLRQFLGSRFKLS